MLKSEIYVGQKVGFVYNQESFIGTIIGFDEEVPETHVLIDVEGQETYIRKNFKNILGIVSS